MVVCRDPEQIQQMENQKKLKVSEEENKEALIAELRKESCSMLCLAMMYAKNFEGTQEDITKRLLDVNANADLLQRVYNKGYEDGLRSVKKGK